MYLWVLLQQLSTWSILTSSRTLLWKTLFFSISSKILPVWSQGNFATCSVLTAWVGRGIRTLSFSQFTFNGENWVVNGNMSASSAQVVICAVSGRNTGLGWVGPYIRNDSGRTLAFDFLWKHLLAGCAMFESALMHQARCCCEPCAHTGSMFSH